MITISQLLRLQQAKLDRRSQEMLKVIEASAKRGTDMVKQIVTFHQPRHYQKPWRLPGRSQSGGPGD